MEFFNAFNRVQLAGPNTSIASSSFGQIFLSQANTPRVRSRLDLTNKYLAEASPESLKKMAAASNNLMSRLTPEQQKV